MHGVPVVKDALCRVRDGPALAHAWISHQADLYPYREQEPFSSCVLLYTETRKTGGSHVLECHRFRYWGGLEKCPLWLLLPSPQIYLGQILIFYPFVDLVTL